MIFTLRTEVVFSCRCEGFFFFKKQDRTNKARKYSLHFSCFSEPMKSWGSGEQDSVFSFCLVNLFVQVSFAPSVSQSKQFYNTNYYHDSLKIALFKR